MPQMPEQSDCQKRHHQRQAKVFVQKMQLLLYRQQIREKDR